MGGTATPAQIIAAVGALADPARAAGTSRFFKTGPGEYGEGDEFVGVSVPQLRKVAKRFRGAADAETIRVLLASSVHEHRLLALFLLRAQFDRADDDAARADWVAVYRDALSGGRVNNWDLVDASADPILGEWLYRRGDRQTLVNMAADEDLWTRRAAVVATFAFLKHGDPEATRAVVASVLSDRRDLIQKAAGWMLREMGKRTDRALLTDFLEVHAAEMGRTALSYAIEHLDADARAHYRSLR
ncbi:DNA alkylation repair protein [Gordonia sp. CPCC 206044]|uniref:DNA alkylation repair protein n=1 Tax=Gordonia sp. CPCC 206044 TaxID=3140793 RepID=UPI003AF3939F